VAIQGNLIVHRFIYSIKYAFRIVRQILFKGRAGDAEGLGNMRNLNGYLRKRRGVVFSLQQTYRTRNTNIASIFKVTASNLSKLYAEPEKL
jgi:hypothetical protein